MMQMYSTDIVESEISTDAKNENSVRRMEIYKDAVQRILHKKSFSMERGEERFSFNRKSIDEFPRGNSIPVLDKFRSSSFMVENIDGEEIRKTFMSIYAMLRPLVQEKNEQVEDDVWMFCLFEDIEKVFDIVYSLVETVFKNIVKRNIYLRADPEIEDYRKIIFEIFIDDSIDNILDMQEDFYAYFVATIARNKIDYFVLKCEQYEPR
ncbi:MAG: hypothetical protein ABH836_04670 [Candidatus Omnitrophota bacterium]